ncbi:uracil phosphoribosyltransferase [Candidatus Acetothermia bacterium]|jgi:uracil phosphoribosyltransferase|nr:uracil phosphoribosyltransferase [Candidatus Acetothermia bacterium]MCI2426263.1 uracil phosphoribosyltransferase [Candidatus Acetothermia bacterium]MCI2427259.1 uracil phosphoribosyltransferase [Candidatus Acetothermia bacterium]MCI2428535.1 uracil phosphoribosyltransferase [Candidatus Acetothermia bacterium]
MNNLHILNHPLIQNKLTLMRNKRTSNHDFRLLLAELTALMVYEITRNYPLKEVETETPLEWTQGKVLAIDIVLVSILRAGTGMLHSVLNLIPQAKVGHIGIYREPDSLMPIKYYAKLPVELAQARIIVIDPMLATGRSAIAAIDLVKEAGGKALQFLCLIASPAGIERFTTTHRDVPIYTAAIDRELDSHGYIVPGLGDVGDRIFGT